MLGTVYSTKNVDNKYRAKTINKYDYKVLESRVMQYEKLKKIYKNRPPNMSDGYYKSVSDTVLGITEAYNQLPAREQQLFKLTWWEKEDDDIIGKVMGITPRTMRVFREKILGIVADATGYVTVDV